MTISTTQSRISYNGNGITDAFAFPFLFFQNSDLEVRLVDSAGVVTLLSLNTDYTVTGAGDEAGGTVTLLVAPDTGERLVINRLVLLTQETDYISGDPFPAETHERALDILTMQTQQLQEALTRTLQLPITSDADASAIDPAAVEVVAGIASEVTQVVLNQANIDTVATNIADVNTVAGNIGSVVAVAGNTANINAVQANESNINAVVADAVNIGVVATNIADVNTVAGSVASVNTVAGISADVTTVAGVAADVTAVADDLPNINTKVGRTSATGSAIIPTGDTAQRDGSPAAGYFRFNTTLGKFEGFNGTSWGSVGGGATGGGSDEVFVENAQVVTASYTIPVGRNAHSAGPISINDGITVTVSDGSRWVIS